MKVIGLIGGCGTGKSEIAKLLKEKYGAYLIIADEIGHEIIAIGSPAYHMIIDNFGFSILSDDETIDRKKLGNIVFNDANQLLKLNQITHSFMYQRIEDIINAIRYNDQHQFIVLEAAVMIEAKFYNLVDTLWLITCDLEKRIERMTINRHIPKEKVLQMISSQKTDEELMKYTDILIDNTNDLENTLIQIEKEIERIQEDYKRV